MYGLIHFDGDGDLIVSACVFLTDNVTDWEHEDNPVIARLTVFQMSEDMQAAGIDEDFNRQIDYHRELMDKWARDVEGQIAANTVFRSFVNTSNGHHDMQTAMYRACEPGPGERITVRLTA